jgi:hypothetical protein
MLLPRLNKSAKNCVRNTQWAHPGCLVIIKIFAAATATSQNGNCIFEMSLLLKPQAPSPAPRPASKLRLSSFHCRALPFLGMPETTFLLTKNQPPWENLVDISTTNGCSFEACKVAQASPQTVCAERQRSDTCGDAYHHTATPSIWF